MISLSNIWTRLRNLLTSMSKHFQCWIKHRTRMDSIEPLEVYTDDDQYSLLDIQFYNFRIWRRILARLPDEYVIPNPESVRVLLQMTDVFPQHVLRTVQKPPSLG